MRKAVGRNSSARSRESVWRGEYTTTPLESPHARTIARRSRRRADRRLARLRQDRLHIVDHRDIRAQLVADNEDQPCWSSAPFAIAELVLILARTGRARRHRPPRLQERHAGYDPAARAVVQVDHHRQGRSDAGFASPTPSWKASTASAAKSSSTSSPTA